jgi:glycosyltransferase involved in cell wall biosynthesis
VSRPAPRIALVHDWLTGMRGGERALEVICERFPDAELFTLVHVPGTVSPPIERRRIHTSFIQRLPLVSRFYRQYLPLFPMAVEQFDFAGFDLIVSVSHCCVKSIIRPADARHICYCLTPMRYAWDQFDAYFGRERLGVVGHALARPVMAWLARWDRATAHRVTHYVANSRFVAGRIARYYNRHASVVHPPADTGFFTPDGGDPEPYHLVVSALVPYKRLEVAILAAKLARVRLVIIGSGPEAARLRAIGGPTVEFRGSVDNESLRDAYRRATAVIMTAEEDFGIVPVEAMACGRPVIAYARGGACETVENGVTGLLVDESSPEAFAEAMTDVARHPFDPAVLRARAEALGVDRFERELGAVLTETIGASNRC